MGIIISVLITWFNRKPKATFKYDIIRLGLCVNWRDYNFNTVLLTSLSNVMPSTIQILLTLIFNAFQVVRKILNNNLDIQIINDIQFKIS